MCECIIICREYVYLETTLKSSIVLVRQLTGHFTFELHEDQAGAQPIEI